MIAQQLFVNAGTIYKHLTHIRNVLGARNSFEMLRLRHESCLEAAPLEGTPSPILTEPGSTLTEEDGTMPTLRFSPRGKEVFMLMLEGLGNTEIGGRLGMSVSGVKQHREKMLLQNDCKSILELIARYYTKRSDNETL